MLHVDACDSYGVWFINKKFYDKLTLTQNSTVIYVKSVLASGCSSCFTQNFGCFLVLFGIR